MSYESVSLILIVLGVCIYTSIHDIKTGFVNSKVIYCSSALCFILQIVFIIVSGHNVNMYLINLTLSTLIALLSYAFGVCAAGDSKLLIFIAIGFPEERYLFTGIPYFPMIFLILLSVSLLYVYILVETAVRFLFEREYFYKSAKAIDWSNELIRSLERGTFILACTSLLYVVSQWLISVPNYVIYIVDYCIFILHDKIHIKGKQAIYIVSILAIVIALFYETISIKVVLIHYLIITGLKVLQILLHIANYKVVPARMVSSRMILATISADLLISRFGLTFLNTKKDESMKSRLTDEEALSIRESGIDSIKIVRKIPFAVFLSLSLLVYIIIGGLIYGW